MPKILILADDLTGANAAGVMAAKNGLAAYTAISFAAETSGLSQYDCIAFSTDSRSMVPAEAYNKVRQAVRHFSGPETQIYSKRIDSTLRGNLGSETDALLDVLGEDTVAMIVPCFPDAGRIQIGGYLLVNQVPLEKTSVSMDPKNPVRTSQPAELFRQQSKYNVESIYLKDLTEDPRLLSQKIKELCSGNIRNIIFDGQCNKDLDIIAQAVIESGVKFAAVDPGPFTAALVKRQVLPEDNGRKVLAAIGTVNPIAREQVTALLATGRVYNVFLDIKEIVDNDIRRENQIAYAVNELLSNCDGYDVCSVIISSIFPRNCVDFEPYIKQYGYTENDLSVRINDAIAEVTSRVLKARKEFKGLFLSGGDIAVSVCRKLGATGIKLVDEVIPLAVYGEINTVQNQTLKIITKGGMVGGKDAILTSIDYLKSKLTESKI